MKLLHAADFHLDSPLSGLPQSKSAQRRRELREIPARLARLAQDEGVDLVLLPGDLFDGERVYPETIRALARALEEMAVPVLIAPGNHDYYHGKSPYAAVSWPDNVHIFTQPELQAFELPRLNCVVHGCAFTAPPAVRPRRGGTGGKLRPHCLQIAGKQRCGICRPGSCPRCRERQSGQDPLGLSRLSRGEGL